MVQLPFLSKPKESENKFLIIDINSSEVKCLTMFQDKGNVKIIGSGYKHLDPGAARSGFIIDPDYTALALTEAVAQSNQNPEDTINKVIISAPADMCSGLMTTVRSKRVKGKVIDKKELKSIYDKLREAAIVQIQKDYLETTGDSEADLELITEAIIFAKIDGQVVTDLLGKTGGVIETAVFNAFSPKSYIDAIQTTVKKAGLEILTIAPNLYGLTKTILFAEKDLNDFVLIDVSVDTTNVAVVFGGGILSSKYLSMGTKQFAEGIMSQMGLTYREADKLLKSYITGQLTQTEAPLIKDILKEVIDIWLSGMEILFSEYSGVKTFPSKVFLSGKGAEFQDLWTVLTNEPWTKSIPFREPPSYKKVTFLDMAKTSDSTGSVSTAEWLPLASLAVVYLEMKGLPND